MLPANLNHYRVSCYLNFELHYRSALNHPFGHLLAHEVSFAFRVAEGSATLMPVAQSGGQAL